MYVKIKTSNINEVKEMCKSKDKILHSLKSDSHTDILEAKDLEAEIKLI
jgi:hypothetical protein